MDSHQHGGNDSYFTRRFKTFRIYIKSRKRKSQRKKEKREHITGAAVVKKRGVFYGNR